MNMGVFILMSNMIMRWYIGFWWFLIFCYWYQNFCKSCKGAKVVKGTKTVKLDIISGNYFKKFGMHCCNMLCRPWLYGTEINVSRMCDFSCICRNRQQWDSKGVWRWRSKSWWTSFWWSICYYQGTSVA